MNADPSSVAAFLLFAVSVSLSPGPNNLLIAVYGAGVGVLRSVPAILGISVGFLLLLLVGASGAAAFLTGHDSLVLALKLAGSAYLLYLAWKLASAADPLSFPAAGTPDPGRWRVGFRHMMLLQFVNPKGWAMALSTVVTFRPSFPAGWAGFGLLCVLFTLVNLGSNTVWAALGKGIGSLLHSPRRVRVFNVATAVLLAASVLTILA